MTLLPLMILIWLLGALPAQANPELCETAVQRVARDSGVPGDVLLAISLTETGRLRDGRLRPWPWAANAEGEGHWFATRDEALAYAQALLARGQRVFDLGCFQINWRWHGTHFSSPDALLDPVIAGRYAADLLSELYREFGSWEAAAGAYHSRTPELAQRYRARFAQIRATLAPLPDPPTPTPRVNAYPLLAGAASGASLVPVRHAQARPFLTVSP